LISDSKIAAPLRDQTRIAQYTRKAQKAPNNAIIPLYDLLQLVPLQAGDFEKLYLTT
jgi:hypothetical protein